MKAVDPQRWDLWRQTSGDIGGLILRRDSGVPRLQADQLSGLSSATIEEYLDRTGRVCARKVQALGETLCWLREDLIPVQETFH